MDRSWLSLDFLQNQRHSRLSSRWAAGLSISHVHTLAAALTALHAMVERWHSISDRRAVGIASATAKLALVVEPSSAGWPDTGDLFDDLVGRNSKSLRNRELKGLRGFEVYD